MQLASLLFTTKGYSDAGVLPALSRALDLCRHVGTRHQLLATLWGTWGYAMGVPDLPLARKLADELLDEVRRTGEPAYAVTGHVAAGMTMVHEGDLEEGCAHLRIGTAVSEVADSDLRRELAEVDLSDVVLEKHPWVGGHGLHGVALALRGDAGAQAEIEAAHSFARRIGQPFGMTLAYVIECGLHGARDDAGALTAAAPRGLELARRHGFRQWELTLLALLGWATAELGDAEVGIEQAATAIDQLAAGGNGMLQHLLLGLLARAQRRAGRVEDALATVDRALRASETTGERFYEAELHRIRGELLLERQPDHPAPARACFETALLVARRQGAAALAERAEASLAPPRARRRGQGRRRLTCASQAAASAASDSGASCRGIWSARMGTATRRRKRVAGRSSQVTLTREPCSSASTCHVQTVSLGLSSSRLDRCTKRRGSSSISSTRDGCGTSPPEAESPPPTRRRPPASAAPRRHG